MEDGKSSLQCDETLSPLVLSEEDEAQSKPCLAGSGSAPNGASDVAPRADGEDRLGFGDEEDATDADRGEEELMSNGSGDVASEDNSSEGSQIKKRLRAMFGNISQTLKKFKSPKFSAAYVAKMAILTAISFLLYYLGRFVKLPFMFPSFFDMQISELPALLAGFSLGPLSGCMVIVFKCLLKLPLSSTLYVGELTDMLLGVTFVLPASLIYRLRKDKNSKKSGVIHALVGLIAGSLLMSGVAIIVNAYISVPFYVELFFHGDFDGIVGMLNALYKGITAENFYTYYLLLGVLPFNLLRCIIISALTFAIYKRLSKLLHWEGSSLTKKNDAPQIVGTHQIGSVEETYNLADKLASELDGGEIILLEGDLGAGKTTFAKGIAKALGVEEEVTSPTFSLLNVYESGRLKLNHIDLYRVENEEELAELGIAESLGQDSVTIIEWNKLSALSGKIYTVKITPGDSENSRVFDISFEVVK